MLKTILSLPDLFFFFSYIFEPSVVMAVFINGWRSFGFTGKDSEIPTRCFVAHWAANSKPSAILIGWMPLSIKRSACSMRAPAKTTTPVVPSPISSSWDWESWTMSLAISWSTSMFLRIVAPSLVTVTSPSGLTINLSKPFGPRDVLSVFAMLRAAKMCDCKRKMTNHLKYAAPKMI